MSENDIDTVKLVGRRADGTEQVIGEAAMSPKMKAKDIVREMFGAIDEEASNDAAMALWCCEQLLDWMAKQDAGLKKLQIVSFAGAPASVHLFGMDANALAKRVEEMIRACRLDEQRWPDDGVPPALQDPAELVRSLLRAAVARGEVVGWQYKGPATGQQWWHADRPMYEWAKQQPDYEVRELCVAAEGAESKA